MKLLFVFPRALTLSLVFRPSCCDAAPPRPRLHLQFLAFAVLSCAFQVPLLVVVIVGRLSGRPYCEGVQAEVVVVADS